MEFEKSSKGYQDGENDTIIQDTTSQVQHKIEKAAEKNKPELRPGRIGVFWNLITKELLLQAVGTVVGGIVGLCINRPVTGALIGQGAGKAVWELVNQSSCIQQ